MIQFESFFQYDCPMVSTTETSSTTTTTLGTNYEHIMVLNSYGSSKVATFNIAEEAARDLDFSFDPETQIYKRFAF